MPRLNFAASFPNVDYLKQVLHESPPGAVNAVEGPPHFRTPLSMAVVRNLPQNMKVLLEAGADTKARVHINGVFWPPLFVAAALGCSEAIEVLIKEGGLDPDERLSEDNKNTALHVATLNRKPKAVQKLLELGADPSSQELEQGLTPLDIAIGNRDESMMGILLQAIGQNSQDNRNFPNLLRETELPMGDSSETITTFCDITSTTPERAREYLLISDGVLEQALELFINNPDHVAENTLASVVQTIPSSAIQTAQELGAQKSQDADLEARLGRLSEHVASKGNDGRTSTTPTVREIQQATTTQLQLTDKAVVASKDTSLQQMIENGNIDSLRHALQSDFDHLTSGDFHWLHDLKADGYGWKDIAELLIDVEADNPWIYYQPVIDTKILPKTDFHLHQCIHTFCGESNITWAYSGSDQPVHQIEPDLCENAKRQVENLCGLAGVVPLSRSAADWDGFVEFSHSKGTTTAIVSYQLDIGGRVESYHILQERLSKVGERLRHALGLLQHHRLCCNKLTALRRHTDKAEMSQIELHHVEMDTVIHLLDILNHYTSSPSSSDLFQLDDRLMLVSQAADNILEQIDPKNAGLLLSQANRDLHRSLEVYQRIALALQVTSLQIFSYVNAHAGPLRPSFLTWSIHKIVLLGFQPTRTLHAASQHLRVTADLANLTCMEGLTRSALLVFRFMGDLAVSDESVLHDVLARPVDIVDTWGPVHLVKRKVADGAHGEADEVLGIEIGDGLLARSGGQNDALHWQSLPYELQAAADLMPSTSFSLCQKQLIGMNDLSIRCPLASADQQDRIFEEYECRGYLNEMGTSKAIWVLRTRLVQFTAAQFVGLTVGCEAEKKEAVTAKDRILRRLVSTSPHILSEDLEAYYGLEFSLCNGYSRRVKLRSLLARALPYYVAGHMPQPPRWGVFGKDLVKHLEKPGFETWMSKQPSEDQSSITLLLGCLLIHLKDTGITAQGNLDVAWIHPTSLQRGLRLKSNSSNRWIKILKDTRHCATFACVTTSCFRIGTDECKASSVRQWQDLAEALCTEVCWYGRSNEPLNLEEGGAYHFEEGTMATARLASTPTLELSRDLLSAVPEKYRLRLKRLSNPQAFPRIRERGSIRTQSEVASVIINSPRST